ncbi:MAG: pyridoxamine 5'-phosphate oxidase family protein [Dehalococcoidia bacterium]
MTTATWAELEAAFPQATRAREAWKQMPVAHLATVRRDGSPRIHPVCPHVASGRLYVIVGDESPKRFDLANDTRFALHAIDIGEPGPDFDEFEFSLTGRARRVPLSEVATWTAVREVCFYEFPDEHWLFELEIESALSATWDPIGAPGRRAYRLMWRAGWDAPRAPSNERPVEGDRA